MLNKNLALMTLVIFAAGCGLEARTYVMTRDRVGLDQNNGNSGCIMGKCSPAPAPNKTTRKVYVLEITRPVPESEVQKIEANAVNVITENAPKAPASNTAPVETAPAVPPAVAVPVVGELPGASESSAPVAALNGGNLQAQTYTVQKDDTLQKISKKIFGTYGKWYKIYEANKDKIQNPNLLKTGTVLNIPALK